MTSDEALRLPADPHLVHDAMPRLLGQSMLRGLRCRCPNCGKGKLFASFLKATPACESCGERLDGHRADDLPAYLVIFIVGHVVVGLNLLLERSENWPLWVHFALWPTLALGLSLFLLQPIKGAMIGYQWALRLHDFEAPTDWSRPSPDGLPR